MAFRKSALLKIGGFDERFRVAGDDVDVCWSLQKQGGKLGFSPAAVVWHHRRNSIRGYWRQQRGYGRAEALLEEKWPEKYNAAGHVSWAGRVYGNGFFTVLPHAGRIYQGQWGTAPFQRLYQPTPGMFSSLVLMPEWYLFVALLGVLTVLGLSWKPLWFGRTVLAGCGECSFGTRACKWLARTSHDPAAKPCRSASPSRRYCAVTSYATCSPPAGKGSLGIDSVALFPRADAVGGAVELVCRVE
jgi:hypothetical protein